MDESKDNLDETMSFKERRARFEKMSKEDYNNTSDEMMCVKERVAMFEKSRATPKNEKRVQRLQSDVEDRFKLARDSKRTSNPEMETKHLKKSSKYGHLRVFQKPLCLVRNDDNVLSIVESVMEEISTIEDTVNIITIAGPYRTGKSYLMNMLAGVKRGFPLGNTTAATTKGLWVWCLEHPERKDEVLMLMDTEGIGDVRKGDEENDNNILCLAVLISGTFVYNCMGVINHDLLKKLSYPFAFSHTERQKKTLFLKGHYVHPIVKSECAGFVTNLSEKIIISDEIPQHVLDFRLVFPTFVLCLRDFTLNIPENETPDTYFENSLALETDVKLTKIQEYNEIKQSILKHFPRRKCFVFGIPASNRKILDRLEEVHESDLSEDFRADTKKLLQYMFSTKPKKLFDGSSINGRMFASLTKKYTDSLANGEMPCIDDALTTMAKQENELAFEEAVGMCKQQIESLGVLKPDDFEQKYQKVQRNALEYIRKKAVLDGLQEYQMKAEGAMDSFKIKQMVENNLYVQQKCAKELQSMYDKLIKPKVANGTYLKPAGYTEYREDFAIIRESIKQSLHEVNPNVLKLSCLEFENRCRKQAEKIWTNASINGLQIEAEIQKHAEMLAVRNDKLLQKEDLKKNSEEEKWKAYKEELASEREKERKELEKKYAKLFADYEKGKKDLESAIKEKEELNKRLENQSSSYKIVKAKPAMKKTVFKTMLSLVPIIGPVMSGVYERFSSDD